jgi:hypothetical protein
VWLRGTEKWHKTIQKSHAEVGFLGGLGLTREPVRTGNFNGLGFAKLPCGSPPFARTFAKMRRDIRLRDVGSQRNLVTQHRRRSAESALCYLCGRPGGDKPCSHTLPQRLMLSRPGASDRTNRRRHVSPLLGLWPRSSPVAAKRGVADAGLEVGHKPRDYQNGRLVLVRWPFKPGQFL